MSAIAPSKQTYAREVENTDTLRGCAALFFRFPTPRVLALKILAFITLREPTPARRSTSSGNRVYVPY